MFILVGGILNLHEIGFKPIQAAMQLINPLGATDIQYVSIYTDDSLSNVIFQADVLVGIPADVTIPNGTQFINLLTTGLACSPGSFLGVTWAVYDLPVNPQLSYTLTLPELIWTIGGCVINPATEALCDSTGRCQPLTFILQ
jgi:hypothetical protein